MSKERPVKVIQLATESKPLVRFSEGDRLRWRGKLFEVLDVANLSPEHQQVVLRDVGRKARPISVPASDLLDAKPE